MLDAVVWASEPQTRNTIAKFRKGENSEGDFRWGAVEGIALPHLCTILPAMPIPAKRRICGFCILHELCYTHQLEVSSGVDI